MSPADLAAIRARASDPSAKLASMVNLIVACEDHAALLAYVDELRSVARSICGHTRTEARRSCGAYVGWRCLDCGTEG